MCRGTRRNSKGEGRNPSAAERHGGKSCKGRRRKEEDEGELGRSKGLHTKVGEQIRSADMSTVMILT